MDAKKIAFIVVGIAAVGGIGYYLYKKNKEVVVAPPIVNPPASAQAPPVSPFSAEEKARASSQALARMKSIALQTVKMDRDKYASQNYVKASNNYE